MCGCEGVGVCVGGGGGGVYVYMCVICVEIRRNFMALVCFLFT